MSDRWAVVVACAAAAGAWLATGPAPWAAALVVVAAFAVRQPWLLAAGVLLLAGGLAARAEDGLVLPTPGPFRGWVTLLGDAEPVDLGVRVDVRLSDGRHLQAEARHGDAVEALRRAQAGNGLLLEGHVQRPPPGASWLAFRHVVGVLTVDTVDASDPGVMWMRAGNAVRDLLASGARSLPDRERPLFLGFVLGDTRQQALDITDDFRGAGLSHLLAVSGQNVAFVLALAGPFLRRVGLRARLPATFVVIMFFALVTRFEPSVLRASAMAAVAVTSATAGREASSIRLLALAVTGLVLVDPFLVHSVGFQLSVGACIGIALLSPGLARVLPGPRVLVDPLAVTLAAQAGVAPVLVQVFGGVPVAGIPANVLAAPVAGPVMIWGLSAGLVAGAVGAPLAGVLHWPTHLMIGWIAWVARRAALLPLGEVGARELVVIALGTAFAVTCARFELHGARRCGVAVVVMAICAPAVALHRPPPLRVQPTSGATLWRSGGTVLELDGRIDGARLLESLRHAGATDLAVVVARTSNAAVRDAIAALRHRYPIGRVVLPSNTRSPESIRVGQLTVEVEPLGGHLVVDVTAADGGRARGPPV